MFVLKNSSSSLSLDYEYQRVAYLNKSSRNSDRHYLSCSVYKLWKKMWKFSFNDNFARSEDPIVLQDNIGGIKYEKIRYDYNLANFSLMYSLGEENYFRFSYHDLLFKNRASEIENTSSHNPYFDLVYWFSFPLGFHFRSGINLGEFDYSPDFSEYYNSFAIMYRPNLEGLLTVKFALSNMYFAGSPSDYDIYDFSCGYAYSFSESLNVSISLGYYYQNLKHGRNEYGPSASFFLKWQEDVFSLSLEASKGYDEIYFDGEDLGFSEYSLFGVVFNYSFANFGSIYSRISYREDRFPHAYYEEIYEYTTIFSLAYNKEINKYLDFSLEYMHWNRSSNVIDYEYRDNRLTFDLKLSKDFIW